jgi:CRISPR/Cas system-associated exonuclease Cas4 (RecB family)
MKIVKKNKIKESAIITASEIGQYFYCPVAWYLQKLGYVPESQILEIGREKHEKLGRIIDNTEFDMKRSRVFAIIGCILLIISLLIILFRVIL